ncbi:deoxyribonuclease IV [Peribacillus saganii]|uniref:Deoxyribonuclease IV n=1 Tax=Peribacillus saganii TaxID=2303992 RepID=A0A372LLF6_9BACI|nr:deoxyribonuclease IV [Peribacillus saganii]RFU67685.1 deoxyribonuclease IV [Peribacillus saganii]
MKFGCHVSIREGYIGAAKLAASFNAAAYQYFPKNPRSLTIKNFDRSDAEHCKQFCEENQLISVAHTPYPTSLTPTESKKDLTIQSLLNDLEIVEACGSIGVVVHFGHRTEENNPLAGYQLMIEMLNTVLRQWDGESMILLENNAGKHGLMGTTLEELVQVRSLCNYPEKIGFCLDTCHAFASGIWNEDNSDEFFSKGEELGYFEHLKAIHLNNSKYPTYSMKDRHANIFNSGYISEKLFEEFVHAPAIKHVPFILETPSDEGVTHQQEIAMLMEKWDNTQFKQK